jgi:hypothetical protein
MTDITKYDNIAEFVVEVDKAERMIQLKNNILESLRKIRVLRQGLEDEKAILQTYLSTQIGEDKELAQMLKELNVGE